MLRWLLLASFRIYIRIVINSNRREMHPIPLYRLGYKCIFPVLIVTVSNSITDKSKCDMIEIAAGKKCARVENRCHHAPEASVSYYPSSRRYPCRRAFVVRVIVNPNVVHLRASCRWHSGRAIFICPLSFCFRLFSLITTNCKQLTS